MTRKRWRRSPNGWLRSASTCSRPAETARDLNARASRPGRSTRCWKAGPHIVDEMTDGGVQLVFNTTEGAAGDPRSFSLRQTALLRDIPYYTTVAGARAAVQAIAALRTGALEVAPLQSYFGSSF